MAVCLNLNLKKRKEKMKMKKIKKLIVAVLAMAMVIGCLAVQASAAEAYYVAGQESLCGVDWNPGAEQNKMTANGNGTYSKVFSNVEPGTYNFKVTDGTWSNSWGKNGSNYDFAVTTKCDVTITFNKDTKEITVTGAGVGAATLTVEKIIIAGTANICGEAYKENLATNQMTANGKVYTKTYTGLAKGDYEIKFCANGSWDNNWGGTFETSGVVADAEHNGDNIAFGITYTEATVEVKLDLTNYDHSTKQGAKFTITITDTSDNNAGGDDTPAGGDDTPAGGDDTPAGGDDTPAGGDDTPAGGDDTPAGGDDTPAGGDDTPAGGDDTPAGGDDTPAGGNNNNGGGNNNNGGGNTSNPNNGISTAVVVAAVSLVLAAAVAVIASKKRVEE